MSAEQQPAAAVDSSAALDSLHAAGFIAAGAGQWQLQSPLTFDSVPALRPLGMELLTAGGSVRIDLAGVPVADSAGLALLIDWLATARARGTTLRYVAVPAPLRALAGLSEVGPLIDA